MNNLPMHTHWFPDPQPYDGSQLRAHWILRNSGLVGDAIVAFRGACKVSEEEMADLEDLLSGPGIAGDDMLHFLLESFDDGDLMLAVYRQRMLTVQAMELLKELAPQADLRREGDDLYLGAGKLSISVATRSPVSTLIHFALNIANSGTPVQTACLQDLQVPAEAFAQSLCQKVADEHQSIIHARARVRAKGDC